MHISEPPLDLCMVTAEKPGEMNFTHCLSYVYTRREATAIIDTTAGASNIAEMFPLGVISPWQSYCCGEFPWLLYSTDTGDIYLPSQPAIHFFPVMRRLYHCKCLKEPSKWTKRIYLSQCTQLQTWKIILQGLYSLADRRLTAISRCLEAVRFRWHIFEPRPFTECL